MRTVTVRGISIGKGTPKICVPIVGATEEEILKMAEEAAESQADLVEWRADWYEQIKEPERAEILLKKIRRSLKSMPLLLTFRTAGEGGEKELSDEEYEAFSRFVIRSGCIDLLDVEFSRKSELVQRLLYEAHEHKVMVILSSHDFTKTPLKDEMIAKLCAMQKLGGDILKLAVMPKDKKDVLTLMEATLEMKEKYADRPLITMSMSAIGSISRMAGEFFGSDVTFGMIGKASAPGQIPDYELKESMRLIRGALSGKNIKKNIYLIGFMGCGKSTVATRMAWKHHLERIEMDEEIEKQQGLTISEIFEVFGEKHFRKIETSFLESLLTKQNLVVSCGGGAVLKPENVALMKENGLVVLLTARPETILEHVRYDEKRPLLKGKKNVEDIKKLMEARKEKYEIAADLLVQTDGKTAAEIAEEIMERISDC